MIFPAVLIVVIAGMFGCVMGSFLNVIAMRRGRGELAGGRSYCESCRHALSWKELIPVASFLIQKGRCRRCGAALSWQYPLTELGTAALFGTAMWLFLPGADGFFLTALILANLFIGLSAGIVVLISDLRFQIIPNAAVGTLLAVGIAETFRRREFFVFGLGGGNSAGMGEDGAAAIGIALFLAGLWFFSRGRWIGFGDAKLIGATSLILGFPASLAGLLFSFWIGGVAGAGLLAAGYATAKSRIPFGPFILAGTVAAYYFSDHFFAILFHLW